MSQNIEQSKKTVSQSQYLQLVGLLALARNHFDHIKDIERATNELLGFKDADWVSEAVWPFTETPLTAKTLLERLDIAVEAQTDETPPIPQ